MDLAMNPEIMGLGQAKNARDFYALTKGILSACEPFGPVHSFKFVHNPGAGRVACLIELESPKQQPALARALGGHATNGRVCVEIPVRHDFEAGKKVLGLAPQAAPAQPSSAEIRAANR
jgi:hypothetical protein